MKETNNHIRQKDLEELVQNKIFKFFDNQTIMVTGATGLIGSEIVLAFLCANRIKNFNTKVIGVVRNFEKAKQVFECVLDNPNLEIIVQDIAAPIEYKNHVDYIVHTASITSSKMMIEKPVECIFTTLDGTRNILEFSKQQNVKSVCYLSSLEVYGTKTPKEVKENNYGILDSINIRNSYPISKKLAENLCASYHKEYGVNAVIARLTQTFGAGISKDENRVFAQFAKSIINKEDLILHTDGSSLKNYCYITDTVSGILTILIKGSFGEAYNIANYNTAVSIKDMAQILANKYHVGVKFVTDNKEYGYAEKIEIKLNTEKLEQLGWRADIGLAEMFERLITSL